MLWEHEKMQRFIAQDNIHAIFATIRNKFAIFYYLRLFSTKQQTKMHKKYYFNVNDVDILTFSKIVLHFLRNRRIFVAVFWLFSAFFFSKTQL